MAGTTLALPERYSLHQADPVMPFELRRDGHLVLSKMPLGFVPTLEAEDTPELRAFAAAMLLAADDGWRAMDDQAPRDGSGFLAFGRHEIDNGRKWVIGDFWYAIILWDVWSGQEPRWVFSKDGMPVWSEPSHYQLLKPPRAVLAIAAAERRS